VAAEKVETGLGEDKTRGNPRSIYRKTPGLSGFDSSQGKLKRGKREIRKSGGGDINNKGTALKDKKKFF
jgi:hypothetical protein